jgi:tetratricopeptide (TPR) repeat protein
VLREVDPEEPRALYGLAIVAGQQQDQELAKSYFLFALKRAREPFLLGWTHIYLGRIYDLESSREQALGHYQAALGLKSGLEKIEEAARRGLAQPFGQSEEPGRGQPN